ncbi:xanthine dehydrogenase/oxidase-like [Bicyclus anynana]|uniref:Xanthine dehydrogenase/oxidase-like n=1 Tax=Bicyclus anynana TaxID=110368 RepID=A0ABM3LSR4_BICAN|nr:xanthine dehydrogenase/oxidase-like [Bicyclus anynana]
MIMERIAYELNLDPIAVRLRNLDKKNYNDVAKMFDALKNNSDYEKRRYAVDKFNKANRWRKRGLRFTFMKWSATVSCIMNVIMSVYIDGSVAITHGGVEMGQGINTKAIQICAYLLNIPIAKIHTKSYKTSTNPNNSYTAASVTSQSVGIGVQRCCEELLKRLEPIKAQMKNPLWEQLIMEAFKLGINLQTNSFVGFDDTNSEHIVYGVTLAEVEIDILTGQWEILRVDLMEDVGRSVSPFIDIGQVEGAFIMGVGYWTTEELVYDQCTGELLTDRSLNYHVPQGTDIPQDFRIYLRKKSYNSDLVFGSKVVGEPPNCMGVAVPIAMREAIASARLDGGIPTTKWFQIDGPYTVEKICLACKTNIEDMKYF